MIDIRLPDSEIKVMDFIWDKKETNAKDTALYMEATFGWKKNTTYTVLKNLQIKNAIERIEPGFVVRPLIERQEVGREEAKNVVERFYKGSAAALFSSFIEEKAISKEEVAEILSIIEGSK